MFPLPSHFRNFGQFCGAFSKLPPAPHFHPLMSNDEAVLPISASLSLSVLAEPNFRSFQAIRF